MSAPGASTNRAQIDYALQVAAAQNVNSGQFDDADKQLAVAQKKLETEEKSVKDDVSRARLAAAAQGIAQTRQALKPTSASAAPMAAPARRAKALEMNAAGMQEQGF